MSFMRKLEAPDGTGFYIEVLHIGEFDKKDLVHSPVLKILVGTAEDWDMINLLFGRFSPGDALIVAPLHINWIELLLKLGIYESPILALKDWHKRRGEPVKIRPGFQAHWLSSPVQIQLQVWKPMHQAESAT